MTKSVLRFTRGTKHQYIRYIRTIKRYSLYPDVNSKQDSMIFNVQAVSRFRQHVRYSGLRTRIPDRTKPLLSLERYTRVRYTDLLAVA